MYTKRGLLRFYHDYYKKAIFETERFRNIKEYLVTIRNQIKSAHMHSMRTLFLDT